MEQKTFYHITLPETWAAFAEQDFYVAESLHTEGFIHGSYAEQLAETLALYYKNVPKVLLLRIEPSLLTAKLLVEASRNGDLFPHIYGAINKSAIVEIIERDLGAV